MIPWWVLVPLLVAYVAGIVLLVLASRHERDGWFRLGVEAGAAACRKDALTFNRQRGVRVLIDVADVGEEWAEHRFHWVLWDADKFLLPDQELGVVRPYREGAAPSQGAAYSQALQAVIAMRDESAADIQVVTR